jgi:hypothetical protein
MCNFTVTIEATLSDIKVGTRKITISGDHGYSDPEEWVHPTARRVAEHFRQHAIQLGSSVAGLTRSNILDAINSPSGKDDSRSYMTRTEYGRAIEYHRHGEFRDYHTTLPTIGCYMYNARFYILLSVSETHQGFWPE